MVWQKVCGAKQNIYYFRKIALVKHFVQLLLNSTSKLNSIVAVKKNASIEVFINCISWQ